MNPIRVVVPFTTHDAKLAERLARWIGTLEQKPIGSVVLIPSVVVPVETLYSVYRHWREVAHAVEVEVCEHPDGHWPIGPNLLFDWASRKLRSPFLWLEPDCVPLVPGWMDKLEAAYARCKKPILCDFYDQFHCSGIAVYAPESARVLSQTGDRTKAWDARSPEVFRTLAADTGLIQHFWGKEGIPPRFANVADGTEGSVTKAMLNPHAVLFHRCKDGSLMDVLRPGWEPRPAVAIDAQKTSTVFVALGRYGDIIHILPALRGLGRCTLAVSKAFAGVLDGVSYVDPLVLDIPHTDVLRAKDELGRKFNRVSITQMSAPGWAPPRKCQTFTEDAWARLGMLHRYHDAQLSLEFDRRDYARERILVKRFVPEVREKPFVLLNLEGHSSAFADAGPFLSALKDLVGSEVTFCDISKVHAFRIFDLVGLMDVADALVTIDTATLHLAAASAVPVVSLLSGNGGWYRSKPRCRNLLSVDASDWRHSMQQIAEALNGLRTGKVIHVFERHGELNVRERAAQSTWEKTGWVLKPFDKYPRDARSIGDKRDLPFMRDCLEHGLRDASDADTIVLTNSDVSIGSEVQSELARIMARGVVATCRRVDVGPAPNDTPRLHTGRDLLAFRAGWLRRHLSQIPDFILGASQWDSWATQFSRRLVGAAPQISENAFGHVPDCEVNPTLQGVTHVRHRAYWLQNQNAPSEVHNDRLYREWLRVNEVVLR